MQTEAARLRIEQIREFGTRGIVNANGKRAVTCGSEGPARWWEFEGRRVHWNKAVNSDPKKRRPFVALLFGFGYGNCQVRYYRPHAAITCLISVI